jgi:coenzyme F420-0:L-glutamate ligase
MKVTAIKTSLFKKGDSIVNFILNNLPQVSEGDVIVITSKIVALSEGRIADLDKKDNHILSESRETIETPWATLALTDENGWIINAGIDESNSDESIILLPKNANQIAKSLYTKIKNHYGLAKLGIIITDTRSTPLRAGTIGRTIGYAGFKPFKSYVGKDDLYGKQSRVTESNHADALAAAAVCMMGEGDEQTPLAVISNSPVSFIENPLAEDDTKLFLLPSEDIFTHVFTSINPKIKEG